LTHSKTNTPKIRVYVLFTDNGKSQDGPNRNHNGCHSRQGAGGQNMNKLASAIYLHFNIGVSSLPATDKKRLLKLNYQRIAKDGSVIIKAQSHRTQNQT